MMCVAGAKELDVSIADRRSKEVDDGSSRDTEIGKGPTVPISAVASSRSARFDNSPTTKKIS